VTFRSVFLGLGFDQLAPGPAPESHAAEDYAVAFSANERAYLSVFMAAPVHYVPSGGFLRLGHSLVAAVSAERRQYAQETEKRIAAAAAVADVRAGFHIVQNSHAETCKSIAVAARLSDLAIVARPGNGLSLDQNLIEAMLFGTGPPVAGHPAELGQRSTVPKDHDRLGRKRKGGEGRRGSGQLFAPPSSFRSRRGPKHICCRSRLQALASRAFLPRHVPKHR
jgi:hypothetical protein